MPSWSVFLYIAGAGFGLRALFWLIGRWLAPIVPEPVAPDLVAPQPSSDTPSRPPQGDYRA